MNTYIHGSWVYGSIFCLPDSIVIFIVPGSRDHLIKNIIGLWADAAIIFYTFTPVLQVNYNFWKPLGEKKFNRVPFSFQEQQVYELSIPSETMQGHDFEYFIMVKTGKRKLFYPIPATKRNFMVVIMKFL